MDRRTPYLTRGSVARQETPVTLRNTPQKGTTTQRPAIPNALSTAYGAQGRVNMPSKVKAKQTGNIADIMMDMMDKTVDSEDDVESEDKSEVAEDTEDETQEDSEHKDDDESEEEPRQIGHEIEDGEEPQDEADEVEDNQDDDDENEASLRGYRPDESIDDSTSSPFVAVANKIKRLWGASARDFEPTFMTESKIAAEARIRRPREPFARTLLRWKEKVVNVWNEYGGSAFTATISLIGKFFLAAIIVLFALQGIRPLMPSGSTITSTMGGMKDTVTSPIYSMLDSISSLRQQVPYALSEELDLEKLKDLKILTFRQIRDLEKLTTTQYNDLLSRLKSLETTRKILASKTEEPAQQRKINLFASGSGLVVDPYLTSPTRAKDKVSTSLITRLWTRWRGYPPSIIHGPISAFMPWEDMGDCWCSPDSGGKAQIVVELAHSIVPEELIVEHIPERATLRAGSAAKDIELWVEIQDLRTRDAVARELLDYGVHQNIAKHNGPYLHALDANWVRIGQWQYEELNHSNNIQTFDIRTPLERLNAPVRRLAFRSLGNWGPGEYVCLYRLKLHGKIAGTGVEYAAVSY